MRDEVVSKDTGDSRRILLCVTGLSPQVVTETLYALAVERNWIPSQIRLITTTEGANRAQLSLFSDEPGWFRRLIEDYSLPDIQFTVDDILTLHDAEGHPLEDIRTPEDNEQAADFIVEQVRKLTRDPNSELHVSIAGGRKTMGFYLGYALSLFGRPQDHLSHVLVNAPFESCWDFFYPTPYSRVVQTADKNLADTRDAQVTLAEIPFVSLRHGIPDDLLEGRISFAAAVDAVSQSFSPAELIIDLKHRRLSAGGKSIDLPPSHLALLSVFAKRRLARQESLPAPPKDAPDKIWADRFMQEYRQIKGGIADIEITQRALKNGMDGDYFSSCKSKLHRRLKKALGPVAEDYLIDDGGVRPKRYSLKLQADAISYSTLEQ